MKEELKASKKPRKEGADAEKKTVKMAADTKDENEG